MPGANPIVSCGTSAFSVAKSLQYSAALGRNQTGLEEFVQAANIFTISSSTEKTEKTSMASAISVVNGSFGGAAKGRAAFCDL